MKKFIIEKQMTNSTDGYYAVVVEGETHMNRTIIKSDIQFFTMQGGYNYCHPESKAKEYAQAIADGLNIIFNPNRTSKTADDIFFESTALHLNEAPYFRLSSKDLKEMINAALLSNTSDSNSSEAQIRKVLNGIDKTETEDVSGWWETSNGAEFGRKKLDELLNILTTKK